MTCHGGKIQKDKTFNNAPWEQRARILGKFGGVDIDLSYKFDLYHPLVNDPPEIIHA